MNTYPIDLDTADTNSLNQLRLEAEIKYALLEDFEYITDSESRVFAISENDSTITITEVPDEDEDTLSETEDRCENCYDNEDKERMTTSELIDTIIRNFLLATKPITLEQAQTMTVLANLKKLLDEE